MASRLVASAWPSVRGTLLLAATLFLPASCASRRSAAECLDRAGVEGTVCQSSDLRRLERQLTRRYAGLLARMAGAEAEALRGDQRDWLRERDEWCSSRGSAAAAVERCLADAYRERLRDLARLEACRAGGARAEPPACRLVGEWTVSAVKTGAGVQALAENDSLYLNKTFRGDGARVEFAAERCDLLTVERTLRSTRRWFEEHYAARPRDFGWPDAPLTRSLVLRPRCRSGALGPAVAGGSQIILGPEDRMGLAYYDGGFLVLRPQR